MRFIGAIINYFAEWRGDNDFRKIKVGPQERVLPALYKDVPGDAIHNRDRVWPDDVCEYVGNVFEEEMLGFGRLVGGSKTLYRRDNPDSRVFFNANALIEAAPGSGKVWHGDIDLDRKRDADRIQSVANRLDMPIYILREHDARFSNEEKGFEELKDKAVAVINPR